MDSQPPIRRYASAGGVVVGSGGDRILVLLRPGRAGPDGSPEVRLPKGHIEAGESRLGAALREVCEEAGLCDLCILADLGHQTVVFVWKGQQTIRDESYFLMAILPATTTTEPEVQFRRLWLTWPEALSQLTFEAEREWVRRAWAAWRERLENVADQHA